MNPITLSEVKTIFQSRKPGVLGKHGYFSVLVPLVEQEGELSLLYEVRAEHMKRQPGEICFPGGKMEEGEDFQQCAVRETVEELGIHEKDIQIISQMDILYTYSNFTMFPFLGMIKEEALAGICCNPDEVKEIFLISLKELMETEPFLYETKVTPVIGEDFPYEKIKFPQGYKWREGVSEVPIYEVQERVIWGLTGRITRNLVDILKAWESGNDNLHRS